jgi:magnesium transporter
MKYERNISGKSGSSPGTVIYIGDSTPRETGITIISYSDRDSPEQKSILPQDIQSLQVSGTKNWIRIEGFHNTDLINRVLSSLGIHPLVIEDILNTKGRTKIEEFPEYIFLVLNRFYPVDTAVAKEQISIILCSNLVITCSETINPFQPVQKRLFHSIDKFHEKGVDYLAYCVIDTIVDDYFIILENFEERIEDLEDETLSRPQPDTIRSIQQLRHDISWFRRHIWSLREIVTHLERIDTPYIDTKLHIFLRDVYDHTIKISEDVDVFQEMTEGLMEIYLSNISNYSNQIMKMLTIIATIFIPLTFISSIYGMNFDYMPELHNRYGYPATVGLMMTVAAIMLLYFRKKGWL